MAFVLPNFNLLCNIGSGTPFAGFMQGPPFTFLRIPNQACALVMGRRVNVSTTGGTGTQGFPTQTMNLLLPAHVDIQGPQDSAGALDLVECPAGSGRWYTVIFVDDIGKGYPNEHRTAGLYASPGTWVPPYA